MAVGGGWNTGPISGEPSRMRFGGGAGQSPNEGATSVGAGCTLRKGDRGGYQPRRSVGLAVVRPRQVTTIGSSASSWNGGLTCTLAPTLNWLLVASSAPVGPSRRSS